MKLTSDALHQYVISPESVSSTAYSAVYTGMDTLFKRKVAVKEIDLTLFNSIAFGKSAVEAEVTALAKAGSASAFVPLVLDTVYDEANKKYYIVMQWIEGVGLNKKQSVKTFVFIDWMIQLTDILISLQRVNITHRDIKPENIIISPDNRVFLIDFNISLSMPNLVEGTYSYRAPEMIFGNNSTDRTKCDVWGIGLMLYTHYTGEMLSIGKELGRDIWEDKRKWSFIRLSDALPKQAKALIEQCIEFDPNNRLDLKGLKQQLISLKRER